MEYRLKRDLPFAKVGADVWIDNTWTAWIDGDIYFPTASVCEFRKGKVMLGKMRELIKAGWIEEVKPREFYIEIRKSDGVATDVYELIDASHNSLNMIERYDYIKVREVIE